MGKIIGNPTGFRRYYPAQTPEVIDPMPNDEAMRAAPALVSMPARKGPGLRVPPTFVFAGAFGLGLWWNTQYPLPLDTTGSSESFLLVGSLFAATGVVIFVAGLVTFVRARTGIMLYQAATRVVAHGPYRWSRNPMYVGLVSFYAGLTLLVNTAWPLFLLPLIILIVNRLVIAREERYLRETFRTSYADYQRRVKRWI